MMSARWIIIVFVLIVFTGCSSSIKKAEVTEPTNGGFTIKEISNGLPTDGLFRQNLVLYDVNNDGFPDIVTPPPRKAEVKDKKPHVFIWEKERLEWIRADYKFPDIEGYDYGGVDVGDVNKDGYFDIVLANHVSRVMVLLNDGKNGFDEMPFNPGKPFYSRTIKITDLNSDGWPDLVALSEPPFVQGYKPLGLMIAINKEGKGWDISFIEKSFNIHGSSLDIRDYNGDKVLDIGLAPMTIKREDQKLIFFGRDGRYDEYVDGSNVLSDETIPFISASGDYDGDGIAEIVYLVSTGLGEKSRTYLTAFKWSDNSLIDISNGLVTKERVLTFTSNDFDNDGKDELLVLSKAGFHILKYSDKIWREIFFQDIDYERDIKGVYDITSKRISDDSFLIVYNRGRENAEFHGIKGYLLRWQKG
ncbi:MAG: hypothetical protein Fur0020_11150 [Thermodesulfovibrionia bacterium]